MLSLQFKCELEGLKHCFENIYKLWFNKGSLFSLWNNYWHPSFETFIYQTIILICQIIQQNIITKDIIS